LGQVSHWGTVIEHKRGYRSQYARIEALVDHIPHTKLHAEAYGATVLPFKSMFWALYRKYQRSLPMGIARLTFWPVFFISSMSMAMFLTKIAIYETGLSLGSVIFAFTSNSGYNQKD